MPRYIPTAEEAARLTARAWRVDAEGWWWPPNTYGYGRTFIEAVREADAAERKAASQAGPAHAASVATTRGGMGRREK